MLYLSVILLGILQGLTEFLPVSSSGHLAVGQMVLGVEQGNLLVSVTLHIGTLLATLVYFRQRLMRVATDCLHHWSRPTQMLRTDGGWDAATVVLASIPTALVGLGAKEQIERFTVSPSAIAGGFLLTALILFSTTLAPKGDKLHVSWQGALLVGLAQSVAIMPGVSRSGATIAALLWFGVSSRRSFELSMLVSLPAVLGAFLLELRHSLSSQLEIGLELAIGAVVSFGVGLVALRLLKGLVTQGRLVWFVLWVLPLAAITQFWVG